MPKEINKSAYKYLFDINSPTDLRKIPEKSLQAVSDEVRCYMIDTISKIGGHFGAGLGMVELTVALHYVYNTPIDKLIYDVGHQGYPHKILTGRRDRLNTIRRKGGLSGFLKRAESEYDVFGAGHASTSISAALGIAAARDMNDEDYRVVSIIGDGAMTGGMAYEAMNNCGFQKRDITVILNDNNISISNNVSAFSNYFNEIYASPTVQKLRGNIWDITGKMDNIGDRIRTLASRLEGGVKAIITPGVLFQALGFKYFGPFSAHKMPQLIRILKLTKDIKGPVLLHVISEKGKGYAPAENDSHKLHAIGVIDVETGKSLKKKADKPAPPNYQDVFGDAMLEILEKNPKVVGITAAMSDGTGLDKVEEKFPDRYFDVGIAEEHGVTFAAGMAMQGITPVCAIYSTFLQRAYDQINHDCSLQNLHVVFAIDRAGLVGADGPTHHGVLDLSYLRTMQNMVVMAPKDEQELRDMLYSAIYTYTDGPVALRYPRGAAVGVKVGPMNYLPLGKSETLRIGTDIAILAVGKMVNEAEKASVILEKAGISVELVNGRFIKPVDISMIDHLSEKFDIIVTLEDNSVVGGFGAAVAEHLAQNSRSAGLKIIGIPDEFVGQGTQEELFEELQLDGKGLAKRIAAFLGKSELLLPEKIVQAH